MRRLQMHKIPGLLLILSAIAALTSFGQSIPGRGDQADDIDLGSPQWKPHADLPMYNTGSIHFKQFKGTVDRWFAFDFLMIEPDDGPALSQRYHDLACKADVIAVGQIAQSKSHMSSSGSGIYTDYVFVIDDLLKGDMLSPLQSQRSIVVTRPGGAVEIDGEPVSLAVTAYPALVPNTTYLLFLCYIPASSGYAAVDAYSTMEATDANWIPAYKAFRFALIRNELEHSLGEWVRSCR